MFRELEVPPWAVKDSGEEWPISAPQAEFMRLIRTRNRVYFGGGLGAGKTWVGSWGLLTLILENRESLPEHKNDSVIQYAMGAPNYQDLEDGTIPSFLDVCALWADYNDGFALVRKVTKTKPRKIYLTTGDVILTVATDAGRWKGATIAGGLLDEGEESADPMGSLKLMLKRLRFAAVARLFFLVSTTPGIEGQGILPWFEEQTRKEPENYAIVQAGTSSNPIHGDTDYYKTLASTMSRREVESRLEGKPQPPDGAVFGVEYDPVHSIAHGYRWPGRVTDDHEVHLAIDWGGHYSCLWIDHHRTTGLDVVFAELHVDGAQDEGFLDAVMEACRRLGVPQSVVTNVWVDPQPPAAVRTAYSPRYWRGKVRFVPFWTDTTKAESIDVVRWRMDPSNGSRMLLFAPTLLSPNSKRGLIASLTNYTWQQRIDGGQVTYTRQVRQHHWSSHAIDALRQYCWRYRALRLKALQGR